MKCDDTAVGHSKESAPKVFKQWTGHWNKCVVSEVDSKLRVEVDYFEGG